MISKFMRNRRNTMIMKHPVIKYITTKKAIMSNTNITTIIRNMKSNRNMKIDDYAENKDYDEFDG